MKRILIAGGTGFLGKHLISFLSEAGYVLHVLTRGSTSKSSDKIRFFKWDIDKKYIDKKAFEEVDTMINLSGANIGKKRWTKQRKREILESRIKSVDLLYQYTAENNFEIKTFISSSAVGFYGAVTTDEIFEETSDNGHDFLATVCRDWENSAQRFNDLHIRTVILRKGIILGKDGGMIKQLTPLAKSGINVSLGSGKQFIPWIDVRDLVRMYGFILSNSEVEGIYNAVASQHLTMNDFSESLLTSFGKKSYLPNPPAFIIRLLLGEMSVMMLEGTRVSNEKIKKTGFQFEYDTIEKSLC